MNIRLNKRNPYYDALRGVAILAVIGIHTYSKQMDNISLIIRQCLNFAVPLFMAISGYMLATKRLETKTDILTFWKRQIPKVYVPMIMWSIPYFVMDLYYKGLSLYSIVMWFVGGYSIYYFIALIIQCYLLLPVLQRIKCRWGGVLIISIIDIVCTIIICYSCHFRVSDYPMIIDGGVCFIWLVFFYIGMLLRNNSRKYSLIIPLVLIICGLLLQFFEVRYFSSHYETGFGACKLSSYVFSVGVILFMFNESVETKMCQSRYLLNWLSYVGRMSFEIYLTHCFLIILLEHFFDINWSGKWLIITALSCILVMLASKLLPEKVKYYLGFK